MVRRKTRGHTRPLEHDLDFGNLSEEVSSSNWLSRLGMGLLAFFDDGGGGGGGGAAVRGPLPPVGCCAPRWGPDAPADKHCEYTGKSPESFECPEGQYREFWVCLFGTQSMGCGECQDTNTPRGPNTPACWGTGSTTWFCSTWWLDSDGDYS